jgi:glycosyltransferase involved in cell wall biosynthesis
MDPLVSILVPAFNAQKYLADTLNSAVAQTWPHKEIIVVDDGSTDQTLAIAKQFDSPIVRVVTQKNEGAAAARNKAFSLSQGDYIQWLDADDLLAPDKIAKQVEALDQCPSRRTVLSSAWGRFMYRYNRAKFVPTSLWCDLTPAEWMLRQMEHNIYMQTATWLVSRELTEAAGPWDTRLLGDDDGEYFCRVLLASHGTRFVPEARVYYRMAGPSSLSYVGHSDRKLEAQWISMRLHIRYLQSLQDGERVRGTCKPGCFFSTRGGLTFLDRRKSWPEVWEVNYRSRHCPGSTPGSRRPLAGLWPNAPKCPCQESGGRWQGSGTKRCSVWKTGNSPPICEHLEHFLSKG